MQYINSSIGVNDNVIINDINYFSVPGPSFTPGIGGTYKQTPPSFKPPETEQAQWEQEEPSQGCAKTLTAGWRTHSYCSPKETTCQLGRPHEPQRHIEPGRLQYLACAGRNKNKNYLGNKGTTSDIKEIIIFLVIIYILFLIYVKFFRL